MTSPYCPVPPNDVADDRAVGRGHGKHRVHEARALLSRGKRCRRRRVVRNDVRRRGVPESGASSGGPGSGGFERSLPPDGAGGVRQRRPERCRSGVLVQGQEEQVPRRRRARRAAGGSRRCVRHAADDTGVRVRRERCPHMAGQDHLRPERRSGRGEVEEQAPRCSRHAAATPAAGGHEPALGVLAAGLHAVFDRRERHPDRAARPRWTHRLPVRRQSRVLLRPGLQHAWPTVGRQGLPLRHVPTSRDRLVPRPRARDHTAQRVRRHGGVLPDPRRRRHRAARQRRRPARVPVRSSVRHPGPDVPRHRRTLLSGVPRRPVLRRLHHRGRRSASARQVPRRRTDRSGRVLRRPHRRQRRDLAEDGRGAPQLPIAAPERLRQQIPRHPVLRGPARGNGLRYRERGRCRSQ